MVILWPEVLFDITQVSLQEPKLNGNGGKVRLALNSLHDGSFFRDFVLSADFLFKQRFSKIHISEIPSVCIQIRPVGPILCPNCL